MKRGNGHFIIDEIMRHQPTRDEAIELGGGRCLVWLNGIGPWVSSPAFPRAPVYQNSAADPGIVTS